MTATRNCIRYKCGGCDIDQCESCYFDAYSAFNPDKIQFKSDPLPANITRVADDEIKGVQEDVDRRLVEEKAHSNNKCIRISLGGEEQT